MNELEKAMAEVLMLKDAVGRIKVTKTEKKMRKQLYKVDLRMSNGTKLPIVVATCYIERLPEIIRNNKKYYDRPEYHVEGWNLVESCPTIQLSEHQYEEELTYVDIQDEEE